MVQIPPTKAITNGSQCEFWKLGDGVGLRAILETIEVFTSTSRSNLGVKEKFFHLKIKTMMFVQSIRYGSDESMISSNADIAELCLS